MPIYFKGITHEQEAARERAKIENRGHILFLDVENNYTKTESTEITGFEFLSMIIESACLEEAVDLYWADYYVLDESEDCAESELYDMKSREEILLFIQQAELLWRDGYREIEFDTMDDGTERIRLYRVIEGVYLWPR